MQRQLRIGNLHLAMGTSLEDAMIDKSALDVNFTTVEKLKNILDLKNQSGIFAIAHSESGKAE